MTSRLVEHRFEEVRPPHVINTKILLSIKFKAKPYSRFKIAKSSETANKIE